MKISVIVTSYNYREYVLKAINGAIAQSITPWEIIVIDDGSSDGTVDLLNNQDFGSDVVKVIPKSNGGQLSAFREGYRNSTGDIVAFLDADDYWDASYLERLQAVYLANDSVDFVFTNVRYFGRKTGELNKGKSTEEHVVDLGITCSLVALSDDPPWIGSPTSAISMRRDHLGKILQIPADFDNDWKIRADDVIVRGSSILGGHKCYISEPCVNYRVHGENGWFERKCDAANLVKFQVGSERMMNWFRFAAFGGRRPGYLVVFYEFKAIQKPSIRQFAVYSRLIWRAEGGFFQKCKAAAMMANHWRRRCLV